MKHLLISALAVSLLVAAPLAQAQGPIPAKVRPAKAAERQAAMHSILAQLKAFGRDDYKTAITYQSTGLKKQFLSADAFRTMMVRTYPEFAHYKSATFGSAQCDPTGAHLAILASVTGQDGVTVKVLYLMMREGKVYRVAGVAGGAQLPADMSAPAKDV